jgi:hypothetical protein
VCVVHSHLVDSAMTQPPPCKAKTPQNKIQIPETSATLLCARVSFVNVPPVLATSS